MRINTHTWATVLTAPNKTHSGDVQHDCPVSDIEFSSGDWKQIAIRAAQDNVNRMFGGNVLSAITASAELWDDNGNYIKSVDL